MPLAIDPFHPALGTMRTAEIPAGSFISSLVVAEPTQPCWTTKAIVTLVPGGAWPGSGSRWAEAGSAGSSAAAAPSARASNGRMDTDMAEAGPL